MFIKEIKKKNAGYEKEFVSHRLVESYRTDRGPRQRALLNLGKLDLPKEHWKLLADRIEAKITGQTSLFAIDEQIESLATHYASLLIQKGVTLSASAIAEKAEPEYETVDINSISHSRCRTIGGEHVGLSTFRKLQLDTLFVRLGFSKTQVDLAALSIVGRLVYPASERRTREWARHLSGLDELLGTDFSHLSNNALYRISDLVLLHQADIEKHLKLRERDLFSLKENIILYDLTNTYFEGSAQKNEKAKRGRSKEKRSDCPLVTLGLVIDEFGFPKTSKVFSGNVSEGKTLLGMLETLQGKKIKKPEKSEIKAGIKKPSKGITVVLDAGIATEDNLDLLKYEGYDYICVARNKPIDIAEVNDDDLLTIKQDKNNKVEAILLKKDDESILYCKSFLKGKKEKAMKMRLQKRFEEGLEGIAASLCKKRGVKKYDKVIERIGRLKEKNASIAHYYKIDVKQEGEIVPSGGINWTFENEQKADQRFSGTYFLRSSRTDLNEKDIWSLYVMLTNVEDAFRSLKSDLDFRPVFHRKEFRVDAHLFIAVLAYHLLVSIRAELKKHDIFERWWHVRELLSNHIRVTTSMTNIEGEQIHIRNCSDPEPFNRAVYNALGLKQYPLGAKRTKM